MIKKRIGKIFSLVNKKSSKPLIMLLVVAVLGTGFLIGCESEEDLTDKLYKNKTEFLGDNSKVGGIVTSLEYPEEFVYKQISIFTDKDYDAEDEEELNQLEIQFSVDEAIEDNLNQEKDFLYQSMILFSLIDNLDILFYTTVEKDRETAFLAFKRDEIDDIALSVMGKKTSELGSSKAKFKELVEIYQEYRDELGDDKTDIGEDISDIGNITNSTGELSLNIKPDSVTSKGLTLLIENNSEKDYSYGSDFILYKKLGDNDWEEIKDPLKSEEEDSDVKEDNISDMEQFKLNSKEKLEQYIQWDSIGELDKGEYLIVKAILNKMGENSYETNSLGIKFDIKSTSSKPIEKEEPSGELELEETINTLSGVTISTVTGSVSPEGMDVKFVNDSNLSYIFSEDYFIQRKVSDVWEDLKPILEEDQYGFHDIALILPARDNVNWRVDWKWLYGSLDKGDYRIVKEVIAEVDVPGEIDRHYLGTEFEIK